MKRAKHPSTISKKLTSIPELPYKKGLLNSSPKPKEKQNAKSTPDNIEPMVLRSPPTGESIVRYALPIPSVMMKDLVSDADKVRMVTKNLKMVVSKLENTYGGPTEDRERDEGGLSVGDDMNSFLLCCSQFAAQLEEAVKEERVILESLYKWFQYQVNQMEEISKDQSTLHRDMPSDDKFVHVGITQITKIIRKFEDIRGRLKERKVSLESKQTDKMILSESMKSYGLIERQIEEFLKSHSALEPKTEPESAIGTPASVTTRMTMMMKIFENQTTMLEKALNDQRIIESKYKAMETDYKNLLSEKTLLEGEIQRLRELERPKSAGKEERTKKSGKSEKKKDSERKMSPSREVKSLDEMHQIQEGEEETSKTKSDQVNGEESKDSLPKKSVTQSGGQRKDQISSDQSKRAK
ncbi:coiled-coil domain-containing protein 7A-like isoform X2 [Arvicanthis niloticus]|uniref:coiled-coil domain-containing protein 7A-like isoform X2 n=1 Tax=Arvicanthis niloticus TaxID=61156 RepID=UPI00402BCB85